MKGHPNFTKRQSAVLTKIMNIDIVHCTNVVCTLYNYILNVKAQTIRNILLIFLLESIFFTCESGIFFNTGLSCQYKKIHTFSMKQVVYTLFFIGGLQCHTLEFYQIGREKNILPALWFFLSSRSIILH